MQLLVTGTIGGLGLLAGTGYIIHLRGRREVPPALRKHLSDRRIWQQRNQRRTIGAALMAVLGVMFFVGANWLDAGRGPKSFLAFWAIFLVMLIWLCVLALIDLVQMRKWRRLLMTRSYRQLENLLGRMRDDGSPGGRD